MINSIGKTLTLREAQRMLELSKRFKYNNKAINRAEFNKIIQAVGKEITKKLLTNGDTYLPPAFGRVYIEKILTDPYINNKGEVVIPKHPDWKKTKEINNNINENLYNKKIIRFEDKYFYHIKYDNKGCRKYAMHLKFYPTKSARQTLKNYIKEHKIDNLAL